MKLTGPSIESERENKKNMTLMEFHSLVFVIKM
jgi:hypothetical protein